MPFKSDTTIDKIYMTTSDGKRISVIPPEEVSISGYHGSDVYITSNNCEMKFSVPTSIVTEIRLMQRVFNFSNNWLKMHGYPMRRKKR